jgi:hypothetical protein
MPIINEKQQNLDANIYILNFNEIKYIELNNGLQFNIKFKNDKETVAFYPTTNKWVHRSKVYYGDADKIIEWLEEQGGI